MKSFISFLSFLELLGTSVILCSCVLPFMEFSINYTIPTQGYWVFNSFRFPSKNKQFLLLSKKYNQKPKDQVLWAESFPTWPSANGPQSSGLSSLGCWKRTLSENSDPSLFSPAFSTYCVDSEHVISSHLAQSLNEKLPFISHIHSASLDSRFSSRVNARSARRPETLRVLVWLKEASSWSSVFHRSRFGLERRAGVHRKILK